MNGATISNSVSGYILDENADPIDGAIISNNRTSDTTTSSSDGSYSLSLAPDTYTLNVTADSYNANNTTTVDLSSASQSNVNVTLSGDAISGTVTNQNGQPVNNATIQVWGVDYSTLSPAAGVTKAEEATDELDAALNKTPTEWTDQLQDNFNLVGGGGHFASLDAKYVAVHHEEDWQGGFFSANVLDDPDLDQPLLTIPASEGETKTVAVSCWDAADEEGFLGDDGVKEDLPGQPTECDISIENVMAGNEVAADLTTEPTEIGAGGFVAGTDYSEAYKLVDLSPGFYRVAPEDTPASSYIIKVGDPIEFIDDDLQDEGGQVADQASQTATDLTDGTLIRKTTTTAADGTFSVPISTNAKKVQVQAYKADSVGDPTTLNVSDVTSEYQDTSVEDLDNLGSIYLPSQTRRVAPPASDVNMTLVEISYPPYSDMEKLSDKLLADLHDQLNESLTESIGAVQQRLNATGRAELEQIHSNLERLANENNDLRSRVQELLQDDGTSSETVEVIIDESDQTDAELRERIGALEQAINERQETIEPGEATREIDETNVTLSFPFDGDLSPDGAALLVHYGNGTTKTFNTSDDRVYVENRIGRSDRLVVEDFPLDENDSAVAEFEALVATDEGIGRATERVVNPTFENEVPSLESVALTSLTPGPNDKVTVTVTPEDTTEFGSLTGATVYGPSGSEISTDAISAAGRETGFTTDGAGTYHVELAFNNSAGDSFTETFRVRAGDVDRKRAASVQPASGPTGNYVLVGDGLSGGDVDTNADGSRVEMSAQVDADQDTPGSVHFYVASMPSSPRTQYDLRVTRGDSAKAVNRPVGVVLHGASLTSDTPTLYREDGQPIPREGDNQWGKVEQRANGTVIRTFTEGDGAVRITTNNAPGLTDRVVYRVRLRFPGAAQAIGSLASPTLPTPGPVLPGMAAPGRWSA